MVKTKRFDDDLRGCVNANTIIIYYCVLKTKGWSKGYKNKRRDNKGYKNKRRDNKGYKNKRRDNKGYKNKRRDHKGYKNKRRVQGL